jgi:magnesium-protoporphyrin O-methyltransferase
MAHRYRKRGLDRPARRMVEFLQSRGIDGATVLEVGGGIGEIQLELLKRGAQRTVNLELSPAYDAGGRAARPRGRRRGTRRAALP